MEETGRREARARIVEEEEAVVLRREKVVGAAAEAITSGPFEREGGKEGESNECLERERRCVG